MISLALEVTPPPEVTPLDTHEVPAQTARPAPDAERTISSRQVTSSAMWRAAETAGTEGVAFLVFLVLARLLAPEDVGAVQLAGSVMTILQGVLYHGFTEALIQKPNVSELHHRSVLAANFAFALALIALGLLAAWPLGWLLGRAEFPVILSALLPSLVFRGLSSPLLASLRRELNFRAIAMRTLLGVIVGGAVAVFMARHGAGYWALVVQQWSAEVVGFVVLLGAAPIKPWQMRWNRSALSELTPVALPVMGAAFLSVAARRLDTLALGMFLPNRAVGIYAMVYRLVFAAQMVTQNGLSEVAMAVLSHIHQQDAERYRRGILRSMRLISFVCACAFGLLSVTGSWLVPWVFSAAWKPAVEPLRVLAALSVSGAVLSTTSAVLMASGYANAFSRLAIGSSFAQVIIVLIVAHKGLMAVAWAVGVTQCLVVIPALATLRSYYQLRWRDLGADIAPIFVLYALGLLCASWVARMGEPWCYQIAATCVFCGFMAVAAVGVLRKESALLA